MKYFCIECGTSLVSSGPRPKFCHLCGHPQSSEAAKIKKKAPVIVAQEEEEDEDEQEEEITLPNILNVRIEAKGWQDKVVKAGSVIGTTGKSGRGDFKRPPNDKYIDTVKKKFKQTESVEVAI